MRVLVTGATGFVGRQALASLSRTSCELHAVVRKAAPGDGIQWHEGDLLQKGVARRLISQVRPTHLLHLAWYSEPGTFWQSPENSRWQSASIELIDAFVESGGERFVGTGTCAEYDWSDGLCIEGYTPLRPGSPYGVSKLAVYQSLTAAATRAELSYAWGRLFFMYGPHEPRMRLVASVITSLLTGRPAACTSGEQKRDYLYVTDAGAALSALLLSNVQGAVNIGSGTAVAVRDMATDIAEILHARELLLLGAIASNAPETPRITAGVERLTHEVEWLPRFTRREGLEQSIEWWKHELQRENECE